MIKNYRKKNLEILMNQYIKKDAANVKQFSQKCGLKESYFNQLISDSSHHNIGDAIARRIEKNFNLPQGYLDKDPDDLSLEDVEVVEIANEIENNTSYHTELITLALNEVIDKYDQKLVRSCQSNNFYYIKNKRLNLPPEHADENLIEAKITIDEALGQWVICNERLTLSEALLYANKINKFPNNIYLRINNKINYFYLLDINKIIEHAYNKDWGIDIAM